MQVGLVVALFPLLQVATGCTVGERVLAKWPDDGTWKAADIREVMKNGGCENTVYRVSWVNSDICSGGESTGAKKSGSMLMAKRCLKSRDHLKGGSCNRVKCGSSKSGFDDSGENVDERGMPILHVLIIAICVVVCCLCTWGSCVWLRKECGKGDDDEEEDEEKLPKVAPAPDVEADGTSRPAVDPPLQLQLVEEDHHGRQWSSEWYCNLYSKWEGNYFGASDTNNEHQLRSVSDPNAQHGHGKINAHHHHHRSGENRRHHHHRSGENRRRRSKDDFYWFTKAHHRNLCHRTLVMIKDQKSESPPKVIQKPPDLVPPDLPFEPRLAWHSPSDKPRPPPDMNAPLPPATPSMESQRPSHRHSHSPSNQRAYHEAVRVSVFLSSNPLHRTSLASDKPRPPPDMNAPSPPDTRNKPRPPPDMNAPLPPDTPSIQSQRHSRSRLHDKSMGA